MEYVYFISDGNGPIKIGRAKDPVSRLRDLQVAHHSRLYVDGVMRVRDASVTEKHLHKKFADHRRVGEWFERHDALLEFIQMFAVDSNQPEPVLKWQIEEKRVERVRLKQSAKREVLNRFAKESGEYLSRAAMDILHTAGSLHEFCHRYANEHKIPIPTTFEKDFRSAIKCVLPSENWQGQRMILNSRELSPWAKEVREHYVNRIKDFVRCDDDDETQLFEGENNATESSR